MAQPKNKKDPVWRKGQNIVADRARVDSEKIEKSSVRPAKPSS